MDGKFVYLESDEEITGVIDKISKVDSDQAVLVVPRGGNIAQSIVNLKLIKKRAADLDKEVSLVTTDKISRNLASQVGISVYSKVEEVGRRSRPVIQTPPPPDNRPETIKSNVPAPEAERPVEELPDVPGVKIHRYYDERLAEKPAIKKDEPAEPPEPVEAERPPIVADQEETDEEDEPIKNENERTENKIEKSKIVETPDFSHKPKKQSAGRRFRPLRKRWALLAFIASGVLITLILGYLILPQAKVEIVFQAENYQNTAELTIDRNISEIDNQNLKLPAHENFVEKEANDKYPATGKKNIGNKATGSVTLYNSWSDEAQPLAAGSTLTTGDKKFLTKSAVTIPGASIALKNGQVVTTPGTATVEVEATESGESYNIAPATFVIVGLSAAKQEKIYAKNTTAFSGGDTKEVAIVLEDDILKAKETTGKKLSESAKEEVLKKLPEADLYVEGSLSENLIQLDSSQNVGSQVVEFTISGKIKTTILSTDKNDFYNLVIEKFESGLKEDRVLVQRDKIEYHYQILNSDFVNGKIEYQVEASGKISSQVDAEGLKEELRGKSFEQAKSIIEKLDLVLEANIKMVPELNIYRSLPLFAKSIEIVANYKVD
jgi:hypothetical protein